MKCHRQFSFVIITSLVAASACRAEDDELAPLLKTIQAVDKEAKGHREAATAWKKLVQADAAALPAVLVALDDANPLAANWLRSAAETIADRQIDRGQRLPADALEKCITNRACVDWPSICSSKPMRRPPTG
jgi:hypothetical protein